ncbi:hypothetical protein K449DRAFT_468469 [Hypoxylon sp. EC38]|nr:hypothetical protein K449DRAFT_468469 [Hypoxylon sp. EC38]
MVKENDVIAIIIIVLFIVLALIAFGIYRLVHLARTQGTITEGSGTGDMPQRPSAFPSLGVSRSREGQNTLIEESRGRDFPSQGRNEALIV